MTKRDPTCRFPGCCAKKYTDAHHIEHWADGGETSLDTLVTLCRHHHRLLHRGIYEISVENAELVFTTHSGEEFGLQPLQPPLEKIGYSVDSRTCVPNWYGDSCDYGMAIDALLQRDQARFSGNADGATP